MKRLYNYLFKLKEGETVSVGTILIFAIALITSLLLTK
jgi:hypothetical protein